MNRVQRLDRSLSRMPVSSFELAVYSTTVALYVFGVWLHWPYGGGHVYSDITTVFQLRICPPAPGSNLYYPALCTFQSLHVPYLQSFMEYPVLVGMFVYVNSVLGSIFATDVLTGYYIFTVFFLLIPCLLSVRELLRIAELRGASRNRTLWYFVITPTFIFLTLLNWYIIGVYFALAATRKYLQGSSAVAGLLFGLSAASNFVTAAPALGLLIGSRRAKEGVLLAAPALGTYAAVNAPFVILNQKMWSASFQYIYNSNIEGSWMQAILPSLGSTERHYVSLVVFAAVVGVMLWARIRRIASDPLVYAFASMFGYAFSTYVSPPQLNLALLPLFVLLPVSGYLEFLAFDILNTLIILVGFSQALSVLGIAYTNFQPINRGSPVFWVEVAKSIWEGRFTFFSGVWRRKPQPLSARLAVDPSPSQGVVAEDCKTA